MTTEVTWWVTYRDNYPGREGMMHGYFANADCGTSELRNAPIELHPASGCLIDHESRIAEVEIPQWIKTDLERNHWEKENNNS